MTSASAAVLPQIGDVLVIKEHMHMWGEPELAQIIHELPVGDIVEVLDVRNNAIGLAMLRVRCGANKRLRSRQSVLVCGAYNSPRRDRS